MKNILLLVHDDEGQEARFQAALDVTRALGGHLTCLDVTAMQVIPGDGYGCDGTAMLLADETERETANRARLQQRLAGEDVAWDWIDVTGFLERCIEEQAALADLIVVNRNFDGGMIPDMSRAVAGLVVRAGKPILAVPETLKALDVAGDVLIAWDGSNQAAAALTAAEPLLARASTVTIVEVDDGSLCTPAEQAAAHLSRHGIHPLVIRERVQRGAASAAILGKALTGKYDYLVMGGFGHSRFIEAVLGGVTRTMLAKSPVPLFIAH